MVYIWIRAICMGHSGIITETILNMGGGLLLVFQLGHEVLEGTEMKTKARISLNFLFECRPARLLTCS